MKLYQKTLGEGRPVFILHGLFGMGDNWLSIAKKLSATYQVILPDLRNHGQSPHAGTWTLDEMAEDVFELIDDLNFTSASIVGHSLGGKVAMQCALSRPSQVSSLVVVDISPKEYPVSDLHVAVLDTLAGIDLSGFASRKEVEAELRQKSFDEAVVQLLLKNLYWNADKLAWRFNVAALRDGISSGIAANRKGVYNGPAAGIRGENSEYVKNPDELKMKELFPSMVFNEIKDAGHWVHAEQPEMFLAVLRTFLESHEK